MHKQKKKRNPANNGRKQRDKKQTKLVNEIEGRLAFLPKLMQLGGFLSASVRPSIRDSEVIVVFADIRGFTEYCKRLQEESHDRKIQNFLQRYFGIFVEGMVAWRTQWDYAESDGSRINSDLYVVKDYLAPTMFKNLGDGMMIVWEIPPGLSQRVDGQIAREVIDAVQWMESRFYGHFRNLSDVEKDSYSELVAKLDIGFAVARGHAWRLDFAHGVDYAGSVLNLTSRLLDYARPRGTIIQYLMSQALCDENVKRGYGQLAKIEGLKGFPEGATVWIAPEVETKHDGISLLHESSVKAKPAKRKMT